MTPPRHSGKVHGLRFRSRLIACGLVFLAAACGFGERGTATIEGDLRVTIEQRPVGPWRVTYQLAEPRAELDLGPRIGGYRALHWRVEGVEARLIERGDRDYLVPVGGAKLTTIALLVEPAPADLRKDYKPFIAMGDGGALVYSGHFMPWRDRMKRLDARLTI